MINSHYVPQFILRGFCEDSNLFYCNINDKSIEKRNTRSVFSKVGYYPDTIEKDLCDKSEHTFANLYHNKIENAKNAFVLNSDELFEIKKYLIVSSIRYRFEMTDDEKIFIEELGNRYKPAFIENLNYILNCNNANDMIKYLDKYYSYLDTMISDSSENNSDESDFNIPLWADIKDILQSYLIFVRPQGNEKFVINDIGRAIFEGPMSRRKMYGLLEIAIKQGNLDLMQVARMLTPHDYTIFPLSENLAVISMSTFFKLFTDSELHYNVILPDDCKTLSSMIKFGDRNTIAPPKVSFSKGQKEYHYTINRINSNDTSHFNCMLMAETVNFFAFSNHNKIVKSIEKIDAYSDRNFNFLKTLE